MQRLSRDAGLTLERSAACSLDTSRSRASSQLRSSKRLRELDHTQQARDLWVQARQHAAETRDDKNRTTMRSHPTYCGPRPPAWLNATEPAPFRSQRGGSDRRSKWLALRIFRAVALLLRLRQLTACAAQRCGTDHLPVAVSARPPAADDRRGGGPPLLLPEERGAWSSLPGLVAPALRGATGIAVSGRQHRRRFSRSGRPEHRHRRARKLLCVCRAGQWDRVGKRADSRLRDTPADDVRDRDPGAVLPSGRFCDVIERIPPRNTAAAAPTVTQNSLVRMKDFVSGRRLTSLPVTACWLTVDPLTQKSSERILVPSRVPSARPTGTQSSGR